MTHEFSLIFMSFPPAFCLNIIKKVGANGTIIQNFSYLCSRNYKTHNVMTQTKKEFKDWDISDFDFANAESLAQSSVQTNRRPFIPFVKLPKGVERKPYPNYPTSNLADVL